MRDFSYKMQQMSIFWLRKPRKGAWTTQKKNNKKKTKKMRTQFDVFRAFCRVNAEGAAASRPGQDRRPEACRPGQDAQFASSLSPPWNKGGGAVPRAQPSSVPGEAPKEEEEDEEKEGP
jgi:hypothetical protein